MYISFWWAVGAIVKKVMMPARISVQRVDLRASIANHLSNKGPSDGGDSICKQTLT